jgi:hypothetical protein
MADDIRSLVGLKLRVIQHLPEKDLSLIVLKGHLLIEELLYVIVKGAVKYPDLVEDARLSFSQLAHLARAISYEERLRPIWDAIFALNTLREYLNSADLPDQDGESFRELYDETL